MPIRVRILLVSLIAIIAVGAAFYREYAQNRADVASLVTEKEVIRGERGISTVILHLQRERGLSAGFLVDASPEYRRLLDPQRADTDQALDNIAESGLVSNRERADLKTSTRRLRDRIDHGQADWDEVRTGYTAWITLFLDAIAQKDHGTWSLTMKSPLYPIIDLAAAQENLGLARATLYRIITRGHVEAAERIALARYYGALSENIVFFQRDTRPAVRKQYATLVQPELHQWVLEQIEHVLLQPGSGPLPEAGHAASLRWWAKSTALIDQLKQVEDGIYTTKLGELTSMIASRRAALARYAVVAVATTVLVGALALFAVMRILTALPILLQTMGRVMEKEDFGVRIYTGSNDEFERIGTSINFLLDYTEAVIKQKEVLASTDLLTQLDNRRRFHERVEPELRRADRYQKTTSFILCDIDHFKSVNDQFGHDVGDKVLSSLAAALRENVRESDILARWGGEEFIIMLPEGGPEAGRDLAEKLRQKAEQLDVPGAGRITVSFGVAARLPGQSFGEVLKRADAALYTAKKEGRNRVCLAA